MVCCNGAVQDESGYVGLVVTNAPRRLSAVHVRYVRNTGILYYTGHNPTVGNQLQNSICTTLGRKPEVRSLRCPLHILLCSLSRYEIPCTFKLIRGLVDPVSRQTTIAKLSSKSNIDAGQRYNRGKRSWQQVMLKACAHQQQLIVNQHITNMADSAVPPQSIYDRPHSFNLHSQLTLPSSPQRKDNMPNKKTHNANIYKPTTSAFQQHRPRKRSIRS